MATPSPKSAPTNNTKPAAEPAKVVDPKLAEPQADPTPVEPVEVVKLEPVTAPAPAHEPGKPQSESTPDVKKPLTIMIPERLGRRLRLVAQAEGISLSALFLSAVEEGLAERFRKAIEVLNADA